MGKKKGKNQQQGTSQEHDGGGRGRGDQSYSRGGGGPEGGRGRGDQSYSRGGGGPGGGRGRGDQSYSRGGGGPEGGWGRGDQSYSRGGEGPGGGRGRGDQSYSRGGEGPGGGRGRGDQSYSRGGEGPGGGRGRGDQSYSRGGGGPGGGRGREDTYSGGRSSAPGGQETYPVSNIPAPAVRQVELPKSLPPAEKPVSVATAVAPKAETRTTVYTPRNRIPLRKNKGLAVGTRGTPMIVETNHLRIIIKKEVPLCYHYDVTFTPDKPFRMYRTVMDMFLHQHFPNRYPAFDGKKNVYSVHKLIDKTADLIVWDEEKNKSVEYTVTIKYASTVDMTPLKNYMQSGSSMDAPQEALQAIDIALRNPSALRMVKVGRSFFSPPEGRVISLENGLDLWYGMFQSAVLGWKPFLNIDVAHKGFPEPIPCVESLAKMSRCDPRKTLSDYEIKPFRDYIKGLKIEYEIPGKPTTKRTFKVDDVQSNCLQYRFSHNEKMITVGEYFEKEKGLRLRYPNLPCLITGKQALPIELCRIKKGQVSLKKLDEIQTRNMVRNAATPAYDRKQKILQAMRKAGFSTDPCINEFGIGVSEEFEKIRARILEAPELKYQSRKMLPQKGVWRADKFLEASHLNNWGILCVADRVHRNQLESLSHDFSNKCGTLGMNIDEARFIKTLDCRRESLENFLQQCKADNLQLLVVVIPDRGDLYGRVKKTAEVKVGVLTQCIRARTLTRLDMSTVSNILLKINAKLNGINHVINDVSWPVYFRYPVMVVGADVTHPAPDQKDFPSIAAVAASHDPRASKYNMLWRLQNARVEIIEDMENIIREQLIFFYKQSGQKPKAILFYRDGVSDGQFRQVLDTELSAIRRACSRLEKEYEPKVTFLVVQKRHHTRFFPTDKRFEDGKNKNVPAGTVVDTDITHPTEFDFFLVSHASIQGTSRPTKYHLLWDDANLTEDELEQLTYYLCHLFTRCTRAVSYPAPTYYAHLAAFRVRSSYLDGQSVNMSNLVREAETRAVKPELTKSSPMFFV